MLVVYSYSAHTLFGSTFLFLQIMSFAEDNTLPPTTADRPEAVDVEHATIVPPVVCLFVCLFVCLLSLRYH